jgi:uncharacterized protein YyaL (SSP411 family)
MPNRLAREASPYLQQHAGNPVDWYPWGPEALGKAKREDKPILLSIGYSACHWCHVMERESFEDEAIARAMNASFVSVKVDREERPDLDQVYQLVVQLMGRSGGWPLTVFLTPDQRPFFGGTYFPPTERYGMPGFPKVLEAVAEAYRSKREEIAAQADEITQAIADVGGRAQAGSQGAMSPELLALATKKLTARFDERNGGFGERPKFPNPTCLEVLLRAKDVARVRKALDAMRRGGIWDHLGGGFHRYSTDEKWLVPHFEKMLYDNAQLLRVYADAWRMTGEPLYERTAREIAAYVSREMTSLEGAFFSTQDADSEGEEGRFFVWTPREIDEACAGDPDAARAAKVAFDVTDKGNFEGSGATVLSTPSPIGDVAKALGITSGDAEGAIERARAKMFEAREKRPKPFRDEKVLASWNALMAGALADAGAALGDAGMVTAAARALDFVESKLVVREGAARARVLRSCMDGAISGPGFLDDHAFVGDAALDLYEATGEPKWVSLAQSLGEAILAHFHDRKDEGFFFTADDGEKILVRAKDPYDHAVPGGASVACRLLLRLGTLVDPKYAEPATRAVEKLAAAAVHNPMGMSLTVCVADRIVRGSVDVVLVGPRTSERTRALARAVHRAHLTDRVLAWADPSDPRAMDACRALAEGKGGQEEPVAYVCRGRTCSLPIGDPGELGEALAGPLAHP